MSKDGVAGDTYFIPLSSKTLAKSLLLEYRREEVILGHLVYGIVEVSSNDIYVMMLFRFI